MASDFEREVMESLGELKAGQRTTENALSQIDSKLVTMRKGPCEEGAVQGARITALERQVRNGGNGASAGGKRAILVSIPTAAAGGGLVVLGKWLLDQLAGK